MVKTKNEHNGPNPEVTSTLNSPERLLKQNGRLPTTFSPRTHFREEGFQKNEIVFFSKKRSFLMVFHFLEKTYLRNNTI